MFEEATQVSPKTIAIDFDETFTADPDLWSAFIRHAQNRGHKVVCITWRRKSFEMMRELEGALPKGVAVHSAYGMPKKIYATENRLDIDIWIDDCPEAIVDCK